MDRMASIELALKNEETERAFYVNEEKRSRNPLAKKMFEQLAKDEEEHMRLIRKLYDTLISNGKWPEDMPIKVAGTNVKQILDSMVDKRGSHTDHDNDDIAALERAINFEARGAELYADLAETCDNPMERNFFGFLSKIEREHHLSLTDTLAYLRNPDEWFIEHERHSLDGA